MVTAPSPSAGCCTSTASVTVLELVDGRYEEVAVVAGDESFTVSLPFPVEITPARLLDDLA